MTELLFFQQTDVYFNFLAKVKVVVMMVRIRDTDDEKRGRAASVKHLTGRLRAWMGSAEIDGMGCKAQ